MKNSQHGVGTPARWMLFFLSCRAWQRTCSSRTTWERSVGSLEWSFSTATSCMWLHTLSSRPPSIPTTSGRKGSPTWGVCMCAKSFQSCPTLCNPMNCSPPGSSVHGISRQEYWSRLPFPTPGNLPDSRIEPVSPALQADSLSLSHQGSTPHWVNLHQLECSQTGRQSCVVGGLTATNEHKVVAFCDTDKNKIEECFYGWGLLGTVQAWDSHPGNFCHLPEAEPGWGWGEGQGEDLLRTTWNFCTGRRVGTAFTSGDRPMATSPSLGSRHHSTMHLTSLLSDQELSVTSICEVPLHNIHFLKCPSSLDLASMTVEILHLQSCGR